MTVRKRMRIEAHDPLFFRDGKPFSMGSDHVATSQFPPSPGVVYGALRTLFFSQDENRGLFFQLRKDKALGDPGKDPTTALRVRGVYLAQGNELLVPLPLDCVKGEEAEGDRVPTWILACSEVQGVSNYPLPMVLASPLPEDRRVEPVEQAFCTGEALKTYLEGGVAEEGARRGPEAIKLSALVKTEFKVGIGRLLATGHVEDGRLYRAGLVRLAPDVALVVDYEVDDGAGQSVELPEEGVLRLGGEGRLAAFQHMAGEPADWPAPAVDPQLFKVVLLTPALFARGWCPRWLKEEPDSGSPSGKRFIGEWNGVEVELVAAAVGRAVNIGGFDMKEGRPKAMWRAVPAGSVYVFRACGPADPAAIRTAFHGVCLSDWRCEEGFGLAVVGRA